MEIKQRLKQVMKIADEKADQLTPDCRGAGMLNKVISLALGIFVVAIVFPIALDELASVDGTSWPSGVETLLTTLLPVVAVIAIVLYIVDREDVI